MREPKEPAEVVPGPQKKRGRSPTVWTEGKSGNPGGRPKGYQEFRELCRAKTTEAIDALVGALEDDDARVRVNAATALLDRGWGRPATTLEVGVTPESALAKLAAALTEDDEDKDDP